MLTDEDTEQRKLEVQKVIQKGKLLVDKINSTTVGKISGAQKLVQKVTNEIKTMQDMLNSSSIPVEYGEHAMIHLLDDIVGRALQEENNCTFLLKRYSYKVSGRVTPLNVDIVGCRGEKWIRIILADMFKVVTSKYKWERFLKLAYSYVQCSKQYPILMRLETSDDGKPILFQDHPQVVYHFSKGVMLSVAEKISNLDIKVEGEILCNIDILPDWIQVTDEQKTGEKSRLNLDVSSVISYISNVTNGGCHDLISRPILANQAKREQLYPVKAVLDALFEGKELFCCKTAVDCLREIVQTIAGPAEKARFAQFMKRITEVPDTVSDKIGRLQFRGSINRRTGIIFGVGDYLGVPTVTSNRSFYKAALYQNQHFSVLFHEERSLTEQYVTLPKE